MSSPASSPALRQAAVITIALNQLGAGDGTGRGGAHGTLHWEARLAGARGCRARPETDPRALGEGWHPRGQRSPCEVGAPGVPSWMGSGHVAQPGAKEAIL